MIIDSTNPATGELLGQVEATPINKIPGILKDARAAQHEWARTSFQSRARILETFAAILLDRKKMAAELIMKENGKPLVEVYTSEIIPSLDIVRYYVAKASKILRRRQIRIRLPLLKTKRAYVENEPIGVVGIISPWNYPLLLPIGQIIPALMAGNAVIFKPSEYTPLVGKMIADLLWEVGIPEKLFPVVNGRGDVGAALVSSGVDKLFFTGSTQTGRKVSEIAARSLTPVLLELGGKDAMIVLQDADLDVATSGALWGGFMNAGQSCVSVERCFVDEKILDAFVNKLRGKIEGLVVGPGADAESDIGPIIHRGQFETIVNQVNDAVSKGGRLIIGGKFVENNGSYFISPIVLADVPMDSLLMKEETFGPVLPIVEFRTETEAVDLANASRFGLAASVWTRDIKHGLELAKKIHAGAVIVNDTISYYGMSDGVVGGVKESGSGRVHGREGILAMVSPKYFEVERAQRMKKLWWYGYGTRSLTLFEIATDFVFSKEVLKKAKSLYKLAPEILRIKKL